VKVGGTEPWTTSGTTAPSDSTCGNGICGNNEYCFFDNRSCTNGQTCGVPGIGSGCRAFVPQSSYYTCGDSFCSPGENCPVDSTFCATNFGSNYACVNGCTQIDANVGYNYTQFQSSASRFIPTQGSTDGQVYYKLRTTDTLGNTNWSAVKQCFIDTESPFNFPIDGRTVNTSVGGRDLNLFMPPSVLGSNDLNMTIDANSTVRGTFTGGTMFQAYSFETASAQDYSGSSTKPKLTFDFNQSEMSCWPSCNTADFNKLAIYYYNRDSNTWEKLPTVVDRDSNRMYADVNHFSDYGPGEDTNAPTISGVTITDASCSQAQGCTNDNTPAITISASADAVDTNVSCNGSSWRNYGGYSATITNFDVSSAAYGCGTSDGARTVYVKVADSVGNWTSAASDTTYYDSTAPSVSISSPADASTSTSSTVTLTYTGSDSGSGIRGYYVKVDSGAETYTTSTSHSFTGQSNGSHTYYVKAIDKVDLNSSSSSVNVTVSVTTGGGAVCGNGACEAGEDSTSCPSDCPTSPPVTVCGDGICETGENEASCASDCLAIQTCGQQNGAICAAGETCPGNYLPATDTDRCCSVACIAQPDLTVSVVADAVVVDGGTANIVATVQNLGIATGSTFTVTLSESSGSYTAVKTVNGLGTNDAVSLLFTIPFDANNAQMHAWLGKTISFEVQADSGNAISESNENNNIASASIRFVSSGIPNLYVKRVEIGSPHYIGGNLIAADFNVVISVQYAQATSFVVSFYKDSLSRDSITITPISQIRVGDDIKLLFRYEAPVGTVFRLAGNDATQAGTALRLADNAESAKLRLPKQPQSAHFSASSSQQVELQAPTDFYVFIDSQNQIAETDEQDNTYQVTVQPDLADLEFSNIVIPSTIFIGEQINISGTVINSGESNAGNFTIGIYFNNSLAGTKDINGLEIGASKSFTISMPSAGLPELNDVNALIDVANSIDEITKANNLRQGRIYVVEQQALYSYDNFLRLEPLWASYWKTKGSSSGYDFSVSGENLALMSLISLPEFRADLDLITNKFSSDIDETANYVLRVDKDGQLYTLHNFSAVPRTMANAYGNVNSTGVGWWVDPTFIRRMHYERINSLSYIWWQLWLDGTAQ
jgi:hypothetical protein